MTLPPGQRRVDGFPRFGTHLHHRPPSVPADPAIKVVGVVGEPVVVPLAADFHCVAGWSATGLQWEGVAFATFYREVIEPALPPGTRVSHVVFRSPSAFRFAAGAPSA